MASKARNPHLTKPLPCNIGDLMASACFLSLFEDLLAVFIHILAAFPENFETRFSVNEAQQTAQKTVSRSMSAFQPGERGGRVSGDSDIP